MAGFAHLNGCCWLLALKIKVSAAGCITTSVLVCTTKQHGRSKEKLDREA